MASGRPRNELGLSEYSKILRGTVRRWSSDDFLVAGHDAIASNYDEFLCDLLKATPRPTKKLMSQAARDVFAASQEEASLWADRMAACIHDIRNKTRSITSGKKTGSAVMRIAAALGAHPQNGSLFKGTARALKARVSEASSCAGSQQPKAEAAPLPVLPRKRRASGSSRADIFAAYGLQPTVDDSVASIGSSPVDLVSSDEEAPATKSRPPTAQSASKVVPSAAWVDSTIPALVRFVGGNREEARMEAGDSGFALAHFLEGPPIQTEIPNLLLGAPATVCMKRPSGAPAATAAAEAARPAPASSSSQALVVDLARESTVATPASCTRHTIMFYKNYGQHGGFGLRRLAGDKRQVWSVRVPSAALVSKVRECVEQAKAQIAAGEKTEEAAGEWVRAAVAGLQEG